MEEFKSPDYYMSHVFSCGKKKCDGTLVPIQIREDKKDNDVIVAGKCPECHKTFKFSLNLDKKEVDQWRSILKEQAFKCSQCGSDKLETKKTKGNKKKDFKIKVKCKDCGDKDNRFIDGDLFFLVEDEVPPAELVMITCPNCLEELDDDDKNCPKCGKEIYCDKCGALLRAAAEFCVKCGDPVSEGDYTKVPITVSEELIGVCHNCGGQLTDEHRYCTICGQEVKCDKCGEYIQAGAIFCNACGDKVKLGEE